jgi:peptidoglycan/xylan/chitin deacetylase (PgdA/CDA1 family)
MKSGFGSGFGPDARPRAIVLTFDNLGEASALERGTWSPDTPLGEDASVTRALPRLLDALDESGLTATFFVEAINCELNPRALQLIAARGHELGVHGWRHEPWGELDPAAEHELLDRASAAFAAVGLPPRAFRPPGGAVTSRTELLLRRGGYRWYSPAGDDPPGRRDGLVSVPFSWDLVDAYHLMERFGDLRAGRGDAAAAADPGTVGERFAAALRDGDGVQTIILHPFLMLDRAWSDQVWRLLAMLGELGRAGEAWVVPGGHFAQWLGAVAPE